MLSNLVVDHNSLSDRASHRSRVSSSRCFLRKLSASSKTRLTCCRASATLIFFRRLTRSGRPDNEVRLKRNETVGSLYFTDDVMVLKPSIIAIMFTSTPRRKAAKTRAPLGDASNRVLAVGRD